jgi:hypothetical protein
MPAVSLHGVTIAWSVAGLSDDPLAVLLAGLAPVSPETIDPESRTTVRIELRPAPSSTSADPRGEGWTPAFFHGVVEAHRGPRGFLVWDGATRVFIPPSGTPIEAFVATPDRELHPGSLSTTLQVVLAIALRSMGLFHLHAAALVLASGVPVIVVGGHGAGKTSTTLALLEAGADYLGDDALYLTRTTPSSPLEVVAFPREFHLGPATLATFPRLEALALPLPPLGRKRPVDPRVAYPGRFRASFALAGDGPALALFPSIVAEPVTTIVPLARAEAFGRFLGSSGAVVVDGVPGRDENLALLSALLGSVRCYEVRLGGDAILDSRRAIANRIQTVASSA